jgi:hypothetical protein
MLDGKIVHIAGSTSEQTESGLIDYGHNLVRCLVNKLLVKGARFLIQVGKEDCQRINGSEIPLIFDWTIMSEINNYIINNRLDFKSSSKRPIITIVKQDFLESIPTYRRALWESLMTKGAVQIEFLEEGWSSGALRRIRMSEFGDILIILSGGEGVEHLAEEYNRRYKPIIPLDLDLGSSKGDGSGGAPKLFSRMLARHAPFLTLKNPTSAGELFLNIKTNKGRNPIGTVTDGIIRLIDNISLPTAFYVRLLAQQDADFKEVENYFRTIVDPLIKGNNYLIKEMGIGEPSNAWMNIEIFESLHKAAIVIVDLTGLRPNCFMELGYALGRPSRVILTAKKGTRLPFDAKMYECLFWDPSEDRDVSISNLSDYIERNFNRPPIIRNRDTL